MPYSDTILSSHALIIQKIYLNSSRPKPITIAFWSLDNLGKETIKKNKKFYTNPFHIIEDTEDHIKRGEAQQKVIEDALLQQSIDLFILVDIEVFTGKNTAYQKLGKQFINCDLSDQDNFSLNHPSLPDYRGMIRPLDSRSGGPGKQNRYPLMVIYNKNKLSITNQSPFFEHMVLESIESIESRSNNSPAAKLTLSTEDNTLIDVVIAVLPKPQLLGALETQISQAKNITILAGNLKGAIPANTAVQADKRNNAVFAKKTTEDGVTLALTNDTIAVYNSPSAKVAWHPASEHFQLCNGGSTFRIPAEDLLDSGPNLNDIIILKRENEYQEVKALVPARSPVQPQIIIEEIPVIMPDNQSIKADQSIQDKINEINTQAIEEFNNNNNNKEINDKTKQKRAQEISQQQANAIFELLKDCANTSTRPVALTYAANNSQASALFEAFETENKLPAISGGGQAVVFGLLVELINAAGLSDRIRIIPLSSSLMGGDDANPLNQLSRFAMNNNLLINERILRGVMLFKFLRNGQLSVGGNFSKQFISAKRWDLDNQTAYTYFTNKFNENVDNGTPVKEIINTPALLALERQGKKAGVQYIQEEECLIKGPHQSQTIANRLKEYKADFLIVPCDMTFLQHPEKKRDGLMGLAQQVKEHYPNIRLLSLPCKDGNRNHIKQALDTIEDCILKGECGVILNDIQALKLMPNIPVPALTGTECRGSITARDNNNISHYEYILDRLQKITIQEKIVHPLEVAVYQLFVAVRSNNASQFAERKRSLLSAIRSSNLDHKVELCNRLNALEMPSFSLFGNKPAMNITGQVNPLIYRILPQQPQNNLAMKQ